MQYKDESKWDNCFSLGPEAKIPAVSYLGFSAETGELADNHDIISVSTKNLYAPSGSGATTGAEKGRSRKPKNRSSSSSGSGGGGWGWFFMKFIIFGFVVTGAYVGFTAYRTQTMRSRF